MKRRQKEKFSIIFFDGSCNLCNGSVNFIIRRDTSARFRFAALQSDAAARIMEIAGQQDRTADGIALLENGRLYRKSTAVLRICRGLGGAWAALYMFIIVPSFIRDGIYDYVARNRYRWFGGRDACRIPSPEERKRFL